MSDPTETRSRLREALVEFARAATRPSLPALAGTLVVALLPFAAAALLVTPEAVGSLDETALMVHPGDDDARLTVLAQRERHREAGPPRVFLIGTSSLREAITSIGEVERALARGTGRRYRVVELTAGAFGVWLRGAIAVYVEPVPEDLVVLAVSPHGLLRTPAELAPAIAGGRLGFDSRLLRDEIRRAGSPPPVRTGNYFLDHHRFFLSRTRLAVRWILDPIVPRRHRYVELEMPVEADWERARRVTREQNGEFEARRDHAVGVLSRALDRLLPTPVVLLETPRNPRLREIPEGAELDRRYRRWIAEFAAERGVDYWDPAARAGIRAADFHDPYHLKDEDAMRRYTEALAARLVGLLRESDR